jgi:hypothetical protein
MKAPASAGTGTWAIHKITLVTELICLEMEGSRLSPCLTAGRTYRD